MKDLDTRLKGVRIIREYYAGTEGESPHRITVHLTDEEVAQIKAAFKESGWAQVTDVYGREVLTGAEWSNRLNKLNPPVWKHDDGRAYYMFEVEKLDKLLASGIKEGEKDGL